VRDALPCVLRRPTSPGRRARLRLRGETATRLPTRPPLHFLRRELHLDARAQLVSSVVTLASPYRDQLAVHPLPWASAAALATAGTLRAPGLLRWSCGGSGCCTRVDRDLAAPLPDGVRILSVYSRRDGVVDWRTCIDPAGRRLEVATTHCGMVSIRRRYGPWPPHSPSNRPRATSW
jgi:hypothetical protein